MAINMEYYNRLSHSRFKSPYFGAKYQQKVIPVRTLSGIRDVFVDNRGTINREDILTLNYIIIVIRIEIIL